MFGRKKRKSDLLVLLELIEGKLIYLREEANKLSPDSIEMQLEYLYLNLDLITGPYHQHSEVAKFRFENQAYISRIEEGIVEIQNTFLKSNARKEIIEKLEPYFDYHLPKAEKIKMTEWLYNELNFNNRHHHAEYLNSLIGNDFMGLRIKAAVSERQIGTMAASLEGIRNGDINVAFHEMIDFIENCQLTIDSPINNFERICLKHMCDGILKMK